MAHREDAEQRALFDWLAFQPRLRDLAFAVPNGGKRNRIEAAIMQGLGVRPGVPDIFIPLPVLRRSLEPGEACGLFIEMKAPAVKLAYQKDLRVGTLSQEQRVWLARLEAVGYKAKCARGFEEAREIIEKYLRGEP